MFTQINTAISRYVNFAQEELDIFNSLLYFKQIKKKTVMLQKGEKCTFDAFVVRGCIRKYYIDENGFEVILQFAVENSWISDISFSIYETNGSNVCIETIEDTDLLIFNPETKEKLFEQAPRFERAFRILVQRHLAVTQNRLLHNITCTAEQKYNEFLQTYPTIPLRVPQHYIASYLGISPEFLSKIRTRKLKS
ncbi:Crp/Fnr family transcriptional regulator [Flavobacterium sp. ANB]|uniref:Crp/Fnr family transcriptional regulator n=1 Tax=unclassified Flavobacterium TaxID=196869 RepID=UPI0012B7AD7F|nr:MULTISPECIES: Crp/Fnr family transcriptional regulator [unclassified Flavobacterium]MBF4519461.1 Crp/Fnr family transcriptional regulator [Flavobacterium sp. ANB]MTD72540.1 Crp/Fnr family transcriptional regulator [Flavobacterium sp. LC2016-13]